MSAMMLAIVGGGGFAGKLDTQSLVNGASGVVPNRVFGWQSPSLGSISTGNSAIYGGAAITGLYYDQASATYNLVITGSLANSGWTNLVINLPGSPTFLRSAANFSISGGATTWSWATASNPIGNAGASYLVGFN